MCLELITNLLHLTGQVKSNNDIILPENISKLLLPVKSVLLWPLQRKVWKD